MVLYAQLFKLLSEKQIEYLVAGGFAVNFHQVQRATADLDLILHLEEKNIARFMGIMKQVGYEPRLPVQASDFANPDVRKQWINEKNMTVFSFYNPQLKFETVDIFVEEPKPFSELSSRKMEVDAFGVKIAVVGIDDLIEMKMKSGRDKDHFDIEQLRKVKKLNG